MKTLPLLLLPLFLFLTVNSAAQNKVTTQNNTSITNLFEYGQTINSQDDNFRNLFNNFPRLVTSSDVKLLSYKKRKAMENCRGVKSFLRKNKKLTKFSPHILFGIDSTSLEKSQIRLSFINPYNEEAEQEDQNDYLRVINEICSHTPLDVYLIKFSASNKIYNYFVFVDPKSNKVQLTGNFFGFKIPTYYVNFKMGK